jgi:hypothetical protein
LRCGALLRDIGLASARRPCSARAPARGFRPADQSFKDISFHDCVVRAVARRGRDIVLSVDRLEPAGSGVLTLRAVTAILRGRDPVGALRAPYRASSDASFFH